MRKPYLSKTQFLRGLQCHKALWLLKKRPDLAVEPDSALLAVFEEGHEAGKLAQGLFPGGVVVEFERDKKKMLKKTIELVDQGVETIYEATFSFDNIFVMVDILHMTDNGWEIYEVKSGTTVKAINLPDLALQYHVLTGAGLSITNASLIHINNSYERHGPIDIQQLFTIEDSTEEIRGLQKRVKQDIEEMRAALGPDCPNIDIGPYCRDPYECGFIPYCWAHVSEPSVFDIHRLNGSKKFELYYQGIVEFKDIPENYYLNERQKMQVDAELTEREYLKVDEIRVFLDTLHYPMYFLDFETFQKAIPPFDGIRPYEQIPFQYSLHVLDSEGSPLKHHEFLCEPGTDPREEIAKKLTALIPEEATVIAYNMSFEKMILGALAERFPKYQKEIWRIMANMEDLMVPFRKGCCYTKEMNGSASLKAVLPALVPELGYDGMAIAGGQEASAAYGALHREVDKTKENNIKKALLEYCKLDTLALVKLIEKLRRYADGTS